MKPTALRSVVLLAALASCATGCFQATGTGSSSGGSGGSASAGTGSGGSTGAATGAGSTGGGTTSGTSSSSGGTTGGPLTQGSPCTDGIGVGGITDPCAAYGYYCNVTSITTGSGTCVLPGTGQTCLPSPGPGCASGDVCLPGGRGGGDTCQQTCQETSGCSALTAACDTDSGVCAPNGCTDFGGACDAGGADNGYCIGAGGGGSGGAGGGVCYATGTAPTNASCSTTRTGTSDSSLCEGGNVCVADPITGNSACFQLCTPTNGHGSGTGGTGGTGGVDAGGGCSAAATCLNGGLLTTGGGAGGGGGAPSICITECPDGGSVCPGGQTCYHLPFSVGGVSAICVP